MFFMLESPIHSLHLANLEAQPCYKAPGDLLVETVEKVVINIWLVRLSP